MTVFSLGRKAVVFELRLYRSLFRWVTRRPAIPSGDVQPFGYTQAVAPVMWLWIFASAAEMVVVHLLVPWPTVRIILLIISAWGLIWMIGFLASLKVHPHLLSDATLRVRHGASVDIAIPWNAVDTVVAQRRDLPSSMRTVQLRETDTGTDLQVGVSGEVNVRVKLKHPLTVPTPRGYVRITELSFLADDPPGLVAQARQHLTSAATMQDQRPG
jgi:hypothetical protein